MSQRLFRPREVAEYLGISPAFAKRLVSERRLRVVRLGTAVRVPLDELERVAAEGIAPERRTA